MQSVEKVRAGRGKQLRGMCPEGCLRIREHKERKQLGVVGLLVDQQYEGCRGPSEYPTLRSDSKSDRLARRVDVAMRKAARRGGRPNLPFRKGSW